LVGSFAVGDRTKVTRYRRINLNLAATIRRAVSIAQIAIKALQSAEPGLICSVSQ
jgi:hypothetical protein